MTAGGRGAAEPQGRRALAPIVSVRPIAWAEAGATVERFENALPPSLGDIPRAQRPARWAAWLAGRRQALAARVAQGDVDSVVNLVLFGTSFTSQPRITAALLREMDQRWKAGDRTAQETLTRHYQRRVADLIAAAALGADERMRDVRRVLSLQGHDVTTEAGRGTAVEYLFANLARVSGEAAKLAAELEAVRATPDATAAFAERSRLFRDRGLAGDSSVLTQFAVDRASCALRERGVLGAGSVGRAAIVGPGLDFADKQEGFDFYPPQSLQPFTLMDSLLRCDLASRSLRVTTLDISPRVNAHLRTAAARGAYRLILPWTTDAGWTEDATAYWKQAGDRIGKPFEPARGAAPPGVRARGITVSADIVRRVHPVEASIVSERLELPERDRFDLVLATNVLLYYDTFEQTLALGSIAAMLRPGGVLLTNDAVLEVPEIPLGSAGYVTVVFSKRPGDGERMVWYVKPVPR
jgi:SAM-dependent methyltransferase